MLEDLVVVVECDDGSIGYGEGAPTPVITGETMGSMNAAIAYLSPFIIGREIEEFDEILAQLPHLLVKNTTAKSALEIALYDLKAQFEKQPLFRMLGGTQKDFRTDITISMNETEKMVEDALSAVALGYDTLKVKIGSNPEKDFQRVKAVYDALDRSVKLRLDANQGWSAQETVTLLHELEKEGIVAEFIEQPVKAEDFEGLRYIKERVATPLLADESVFGIGDARRLLEMQAIDYINIKLAKTAGITAALGLADMAKSYGVKCMMGCMLEGPFSVAAGAHVASAKADVITMLDLDAVSLLASHPAKTEIIFNESRIVLSEQNGLGVLL